MIKNSQEFSDKFNNLILELMQSQYADLENNNTIYKIPSKALKVDIRSSAFYFDLDTSIYHQVPSFNGYGSLRRGVWYFPTLKFDIIMTANSGRTYSYPRLRKMKVESEDELLLFANYMFSCANMAIKFFHHEYKKATESNFKNPMDGMYNYTCSEMITL